MEEYKRTRSVLTYICFILVANLLLLFMVGANECRADEQYIVDGKFRIVTEEELAQKRVDLVPGLSRDGLILHEIPSSMTGTGQSEMIEYMEPPDYDPHGPTYPLVVAFHGYSQSCKSPAIDSTIDEECAARNWFYLSVTAYHEANFGFLPAQQHVTVAIDFLIDHEGYNIDTDRIYFAGYSMGGGVAASYACRHMHADEGYPVAGLILVSTAYDWTFVYNLNDPAATYWLEQLLGGSPDDVPFAYRQISTMYVEEGTYVTGQSMGQNTRSGMPVYITYARNDPLLYVLYLNTRFINMLNAIGAESMVHYYDEATNPHHWSLLDEEEAFDYIEQFTLADQRNKSECNVLCDRTSKFMCYDIEQEVVDSFSRIDTAASKTENRLTITEASNTSTLGIDRAWLGIDEQETLWIDNEDVSESGQTVNLHPVSAAPTYVVDDTGLLYGNYSHDDVEDVFSVSFTSGAPSNLKASYEEYALALTCTETADIGQKIMVAGAGGDAYDSCLFLVALEQLETKVGIRHILVSPAFPTMYLFFPLDAQGDFRMTPTVPNDASLKGLIFLQQYLTYAPGAGVKAISNMDTLTINE